MKTVELPDWLGELRRVHVTARVLDDPRSRDGTLFGMDMARAREAIGAGQADFDAPCSDLSPDDLALLYAYLNQKGHLEELVEAFGQLFADLKPPHLAIEAGDIPDPPEASPHRQGHEIPGLVYVPEFITEVEEKRLLACIDRAEWSTDLQRRVQHYGWRYDYKQRQVDDSMRLGELPEWARELAGRLVNEGFMKDPPDQVIVNEYRGKQGISRHIDQPHSFTEHVATISLIETWGMVFRRRDRKEKVEISLERRSVAVMTGDARYKWTHEIPKRKYESLPDRQGKRRRVARDRRVSLTFRTSRAGSSRPRSRPRPDTRDLTTPT